MMVDPVASVFQRLRQPTAGIAPARRRFQRFYDDWLRDAALDGAPETFAYAVWDGYHRCADLSPAPQPEDSGDAMRIAVAMLGDSMRAYTCLTAALGAGLLDPEGGVEAPAAYRKRLSRALFEALGEDGPTAVRQASSSREVATHPDDFWTDLGHLMPAILLARRRLCRIEVRNAPGRPAKTGTGFLVGPSTVLTNLHVVDGIEPHLLDADLRELVLRVRFDYSDTTGLKKAASSRFNVAENWRVAAGSLGGDGHDGAGVDYWWDVGSSRRAWLEKVNSALDYAVIRLDGAPGLQRGWYDLRVDPLEFQIGAWALHHPSEQDQTITRGRIAIEMEDDVSRLFHTASTAGGSSGGLILNQDGVPIGLHYLGIAASRAPAAGNPLESHQNINVAIALPHVARQIDATIGLPALLRSDVIRPYRGCLDGRHPVFGRNDFLDKVQQLWRGDQRILRVDLMPTDPVLDRPGKSFSADILRAVFAGPEHHHILFRAGEISQDARKVAQDALGTFAEDLVDQVPNDPDTTSPAYVKRLVDYFANAMRERLPNQNVWIVLDDLDQHDLSDASGREFLATLYDQVGRMPSLRIVLIGLDKLIPISGLQEGDFIRSTLGREDVDKLEARFTDWLKARGAREVDISDGAYELISSIAASFAGTDAPLARLATFTVEHISGIADTMFGKAKADVEDEQ
ncbi:MAG: serine protease [Pseudomonadota bacterium]